MANQVIAALLVLLSSATHAGDTRWIRAGQNTNAAIWGIQGGLQFALHPAGFAGRDGGPRGLIRIGYPTLTNSQYDLINFIAVEPIVNGRKGFSELEQSSLDQKPGKRFWTGRGAQPPDSSSVLDPGELNTLFEGVEQLTLAVSVEPFENGAHVRLHLSQRSDAPGELRLAVEAEADSAPLDSCILTATMGNKSRARLLFLKDGAISSLQLYPAYREAQFALHRTFGLERFSRAANGDALVAIANDEEHPAEVRPFGHAHFWDYLGGKVTQYWRKTAAEIHPQLSCAVNARFTYWGSKQPIPGGVSFENFELREPFRSGQSFIFGITAGKFPGQ